MSAESPLITKETSREALLEHPAMKLMTETDAAKFADWVGIGTDKFDPSMINYCLEAMVAKQQNLQVGLNRAGALLMANYYYLTGTWPGIELRKELYGELSGEVEDLDGKMLEGFGTDDNELWQFTGKAETDLADKVVEVVDEWLEKDSPQAKLKTTEDLLARQRELNQKAVDQANSYRVQYETSEGQLHEARQEIKKLQHELAETERSGWTDARREEVKRIYDALPQKTLKGIESVLKKLDPVKVGENETEPPQDLAETDKALLGKFGKLEGLDLEKLVKLGIGNEGMAALPQILRLKLERRRQEQEQTREANREKKAVRDYFAGHEVKLEIVPGKQGITIDEELMDQLNKVKGFKVPISPKELSIPTGLEEVQKFELFWLDIGRIGRTLFSSATLGKEIFADKTLLEEEMIEAFGSRLKQKDNEFAFVRSEGGFIVELNQEKVGEASLLHKVGEIIINWNYEKADTQKILEASWFIANKIAHYWGSDETLPGLVLKTVATAEPPAAAEPLPATGELSPPKQLMVDALKTQELRGERDKLRSASEVLTEEEGERLAELEKGVPALEEKFESVFGVRDDNGLFKRAFHGVDETVVKAEDHGDMVDIKKELVALGISCCVEGKSSDDNELTLIKIYAQAAAILKKNGKEPIMSQNEFEEAFYKLVTVEQREEPPTAEPAELEEEGEEEIPDWLKALRVSQEEPEPAVKPTEPEEPPAAEGKSEAPVEEMEAVAPVPAETPVEPEKPEWLPLPSRGEMMANMAQALREHNLEVGISLNPDQFRELTQATLSAVISREFAKFNPQVTLDSFQVKDGLILKGEIRAKKWDLLAVTIPIDFVQLGPNLDLVKFRVNVPRQLQRFYDESKVRSRLQAFAGETWNTILAGLSQQNLPGVVVERMTIKGDQLLVKLRGKE